MAQRDEQCLNRLRARVAAAEKSFGGWCVTPSTFAAELLASEGFDYVCVDCQHGLIHYDAMWPMLQALRWSDTTPLVRVPFNSTPWPGKVLDAGAEGVIVPMVNTKEDAERAAAACRYAPEGVRSFGPVRAGMLLGQDPAVCNREVLCLVMIETVTGVENVDEICATSGVDGVYIGPADLAVSMGVPLQRMFEDKAHADAIEEVRLTCARHGSIAGIHTGSGSQANALAEAGFDMCTLATDAVFLRSAARRELAAARGGESTEARGPYG
jgi:4-hydroxy-2-oxoheptanedioate aldolase